jgi:hypothetical protein
VDGPVIAAARTLLTWSEKDVPMIPSIERKTVRDLQEKHGKILKRNTLPPLNKINFLLGDKILKEYSTNDHGSYFLCLSHLAECRLDVLL